MLHFKRLYSYIHSGVVGIVVWYVKKAATGPQNNSERVKGGASCCIRSQPNSVCSRTMFPL